MNIYYEYDEYYLQTYPREKVPNRDYNYISKILKSSRYIDYYDEKNDADEDVKQCWLCSGREESAADDVHVVQPGVDRLPAVLEHLRVRRRGQRRHPAPQPLDT